MKIVRSLMTLVLVVASLAIVPVALADSHLTMDIVDTAVADGRFTTLAAALTAADLVDTLKGEGPFTVFAPTDDAFGKLPEGTVEGLLEDIPALTDILLYHVVAGKVMAEDVVTLDMAETVLGKDVEIMVKDGNVYINDAMVIITDVEATNGVIHVIDTVLLPPEEMAEPVATTAEPVLISAEGTYTVVSGDTLYHIARRLLGDGSRYPEIVTLTNQMNATDSSYAHIANPDLIYPGWKFAIPQEEVGMDIVDVAVADSRFKTLAAALTAADLVDTLKGEGPFTVFAPTDDAFGKLPEGTVEGLLEDIPALTDILLYHVVAGKVMAEDVVTLDMAETVLGEDVEIMVKDGNVYINDAMVIITDVEATNGVIHAIDTVLLPPES